MGNHKSKTKLELRDSWSTPQWLFNWLDSIFNFDIDLAANSDNYKCRAYFTIHDNALKMNWSEYNKTGFLNPPYSNIDPWVDKAIEEMKKGFTTVMVIPTLSGVKRDKKIIDNATGIIFFDGRISFISAETDKPVGGNDRGTMIVFFEAGGDGSPCYMECCSRDKLIKKWGEK